MVAMRNAIARARVTISRALDHGALVNAKKSAIFQSFAGLPLKSPTLRGRIDGAEQTKN
jgi:hypothetical protein